MPIKGLTDRTASFPKLGTIRKGAPKTGNRPGQDLDYFRFDSADAELEKAFLEIYDQQPREINVFLPYKTTEQNFSSWMEEWAASSLLRRCDGENQVIWLNDDKRTYGKGRKACLGCDGKTGCKPSGRLFVVIPELKRLGYVEVQTHSKWDIMGLTENLVAIEQATGDLRGIPFKLCRRLRNISTPRDNGRARADKWLLALEVAPQWSSKVLEALESRANRVLMEPTATMASPQATETIEVVSVDEPIRPSLIDQTNEELMRLGWSNIQGRDYLLQTYGKRSRQLLTDAELQDFLKRLQAMEPEIETEEVEAQYEKLKQSSLRELQQDMQP
jgi:hypothetical protein